MPPSGPCCVKAKGCAGREPSENSAHASWRWRKAKVAGAIKEGDAHYDGDATCWVVDEMVCGPCKKFATEQPVHKKRAAEAEKHAAEAAATAAAAAAAAAALAQRGKGGRGRGGGGKATTEAARAGQAAGRGGGGATAAAAAAAAPTAPTVPTAATAAAAAATTARSAAQPHAAATAAATVAATAAATAAAPNKQNKVSRAAAAAAAALKGDADWLDDVQNRDALVVYDVQELHGFTTHTVYVDGEIDEDKPQFKVSATFGDCDARRGSPAATSRRMSSWITTDEFFGAHDLHLDEYDWDDEAWDDPQHRDEHDEKLKKAGERVNQLAAELEAFAAAVRRCHDERRATFDAKRAECAKRAEAAAAAAAAVSPARATRSAAPAAPSAATPAAEAEAAAPASAGSKRAHTASSPRRASARHS